ncbi:MAG: Carbon monoxide dehydrogenase small chain [Alphaproteobacteria bacterium MarineAlpha9_Bin4]|nr:MAG: Carbon monoxide dehydrogenase small chain [Alphaproteobacteria bacterium MarineAlpha9_Bin4]|tara:strand:- start:3378 stop:3866 length:489 start_codon:yes stop_codon:yes gene_type:complete
MNKVKVNIKINQEYISKAVDANILLSDFLRYNLKLTGTHIGCDTSQCGSCIIMLDDKCVKSCSVLLAQCNNKNVVTVEGLGKIDDLHKVQEAFKNNHGLQCGFCTPGILFSALELSMRKNQRSEYQIRKFLDGNFCRCTGYHNIVKSIKSFLKEKDLVNEKV